MNEDITRTRLQHPNTIQNQIHNLNIVNDYEKRNNNLPSLSNELDYGTRK